MSPSPSFITNENSVNKGWFKLLRLVCRQYSIRPEDAFPEELNHQDRHDVATIRAILKQLYEQTDDPNVLIHTAKQVTALTFGSYSLSAWSSPNLDTLLNNLAEYSVVFGVPISLRYHTTALGDAELWVVNNEPLNKESHVSHLGVILFMATIIEIIHSAIEEEGIDIEMKLISHNFPAKVLQGFARLTNTNISLGHPIRKLCIKRKHLHKKIPSADPDIYFASISLLRKQAEKLNSSNIILQIYNRLNHQANLENISAELIASKMHMNIRTLNRRLAELNTSYRGVVEKYKLEKALYLLEKPTVSMTEIAYQLGFSDLSTFSRAFKRWTGSSPSTNQAKIVR